MRPIIINIININPKKTLNAHRIGETDFDLIKEIINDEQNEK